MSLPDESPRESRRRRMMHFKNNWGTNVKQIDEEDSDDLDAGLAGGRSPKSPLTSRRSSTTGCPSLGSPGPSPLTLTPRLDRIRHESNDILNLSSTSILPFRSRSPGLSLQMPDTESYCDCRREKNNTTVCECGEEERNSFEWTWDESSLPSTATVQNANRDVVFHNDYSCGTAAARGAKPLESGQHFWEIKMTSPVYGTDMMVGIGTEDVQLDRHERVFSSFLGDDQESWGLSYTGLFHHNKVSKPFSPRFTQGSIVGVHLDLWSGSLAFYRNRKSLGIVSTGLRSRAPLFPMVSSTAARSSMRLIKSCSFKSSLLFACCSSLRKLIPGDRHVLDEVTLPPGLAVVLRSNLDWLLRPYAEQRAEPHTSLRDFKRHLDLSDYSSEDSASNFKKFKESI